MNGNGTDNSAIAAAGGLASAKQCDYVRAVGMKAQRTGGLDPGARGEENLLVAFTFQRATLEGLNAGSG